MRHTGSLGLAKNTKAFTLIQISIILVVVSLLAVATLPGYQVALKSNNSGVTKLNAVMTALREFQAANGRLPCPADASYANGYSKYGMEAVNPGNTSNCSGGTPAANFVDGANNIAIGMVPVNTLQLPSDYALDGFGRKITYAVDTNATGCWASQALAGQISVADNNVIYKTIAAFAGHGTDGHGAWLPLPGGGGTASRQDAGSTDIDQLVNAHLTTGTFPTSTASAIVTDAAGANVVLVKKVPTATFDDQIIYKGSSWGGNTMPAAILTATSVSPPANGTYNTGQILSFTLTFPQIVTVTGNPRLDLGVISTTGARIGSGGSIGYATYQSGSGTNQLVFNYTVQNSDYAPSGITISSPVEMNGGFINPCFTFFSIPDLSGVKIANFIYVADTSNRRILKLDSNGNWLMTFGAGNGTQDNNIKHSGAVAVDSSGNVWIADDMMDRIVKYDSAGNWQMSIGGKSTDQCSGKLNGATCSIMAGYSACCAPGTTCTCSSGNATTPSSSKGQLNLTDSTGVAFDNSGNLWVSDGVNGRIMEFDSTAGTYMSSFAVDGAPGNIAIDSNNIIWVMSPGNAVCELQRCTTSGACVAKSTCGNGNGQFYDNGGDSDYIAIDSSGNVWVSDENNCRVQKFNSSGTYQSALPYSFSCSINNGPAGLAFDASGNIWVANDYNNIIYKIRPSDGALQQSIGSTGSGTSPVQFQAPYGLFIGR